MQLTITVVDDASNNDTSGLKYSASISDTSSNSDDLMNNLRRQTDPADFHIMALFILIDKTFRGVRLVGFWFTSSEFTAEPLKAKSASFSYITLASGHVYVSVSTGV